MRHEVPAYLIIVKTIVRILSFLGMTRELGVAPLFLIRWLCVYNYKKAYYKGNLITLCHSYLKSGHPKKTLLDDISKTYNWSPPFCPCVFTFVFSFKEGIAHHQIECQRYEKDPNASSSHQKCCPFLEKSGQFTLGQLLPFLARIRAQTH